MAINYNLGLEVHQILSENNLENAVNQELIALWHDAGHLKQLEGNITAFIQNIGLDLRDSSLSCTPKRLVKLFIEDLFWGLDYHNFPEIHPDENIFKYTTPLISKNINLQSTCEHHFVAINGYATVAYIPDEKIIGLGKLNQIVSFFAHRPQVQERLTRQIFIALQHILGTSDVAVAITATHDCITRRGIDNTNNNIFSIELGGQFMNDQVLKANFYTSSQ